MIFAPHHSAEFASQVAQCLGCELTPSEEREFDGGEHKMRPLADVRGHQVFVIQSLCGDGQASANDRFCRLAFFCGALKDAGAARVTACLPYLAYARKDRRTQMRDPVTTRYIAAMLEAVGVDRVVVLDVHNEAAFDNAFRCETLRLEAADILGSTLCDMLDDSRLAVVSPDTGGIKRAQHLRDILTRKLGREVDFAFMEKRRTAGRVWGEQFAGDVAGSNVVLFDDLIASGTTIMRAAQAARTAGAKHVYVAATHAAFLIEALQLFQEAGPDTVLVSNSIALPEPFKPIPQQRLQVCSIAPLFARTITELST